MRFVISIAVAFTIIVSVSGSLAQSRQITEADLTKLIADAVEKRKGISQRQRVTTTGYRVGESSETLSEFGPNDTYHYVVVRRLNGVETKTEGIRIGDVRYTRLQDGSWIKDPPKAKGTSSGQGNGSGSGSGTASAPPESTTEYRYLRSEEINGKKADHYRKSRIIKFMSRTPPITRRVVDEYWFSADGLLVKESHTDHFENSKQRYISVTVYEYDKNISITAPIPDQQ